MIVIDKSVWRIFSEIDSSVGTIVTPLWHERYLLPATFGNGSRRLHALLPIRNNLSLRIGSLPEQLEN